MRNILYALCLLLSVACSKKQDPEPKKEPTPIKLPEAVSGLTCGYKHEPPLSDSLPYRLINTHKETQGRIYLTFERNFVGTKVKYDTAVYIKLGLLDDTSTFDRASIAMPCNLPNAYKINHLRILFSGDETTEVKFNVTGDGRSRDTYGSFLRLSSIKPNLKQ